MLPLLAALLLFGAPADEEFLAERLRGLRGTYAEHSKRQSPEPIAMRVAVVREIAHLPWKGEPRDKAARMLATIVREDRSYRVRAEAIRAIGRVGTPTGLDAMVRATFDRAGRSPRYALLHTVIPDALAGNARGEDWGWIRDHVLFPGTQATPTGLLHLAAHRADQLRVVMVRGAGLAGRTELDRAIRPYASAKSEQVRAAAIEALGRLGSSPDLVTAALRVDEHERVRMEAAGARSLPRAQLRRALRDKDLAVRRRAVRNLAARPGADTLIELINQLGAREVRLDVRRALIQRTGRDFGSDRQLWTDWARQRRPDGDTTAAAPTYPAQRVVFVVDASASMNRIAASGLTRQQQAAAAMRAFMARAPRSTRYAIYAFASEVKRFPERGGSATKPSDLLLWYGALKPAGGSNSYAALMRALEDPLKPDTILFVTDGVPRHCSYRGRTYSEPEQILHEVREANRRRMVRIDTIGLLGGRPHDDDIVDEHSAVGFLRRMAQDHEGSYREVR